MTHALATGFRIVAVVLGTLAASLQADDVPPFEQFHVYTAGQDNVHTYRIPAFLVTSKGTLLVFCEARKMSTRDVSPTDLVVKRSTDLGRVWSPLQTLVRGEGDESLSRDRSSDGKDIPPLEQREAERCRSVPTR